MKDVLVRRILKVGSVFFLGVLGGDKKKIISNFEENSKKTFEGTLFLTKTGISIPIFFLIAMFFIGNAIFLLMGSLGFPEIGFKTLWVLVLAPSTFIFISIIKNLVIDSKKKYTEFSIKKYWLNLCDIDILISFLVAITIAIFLKY